MKDFEPKGLFRFIRGGSDWLKSIRNAEGMYVEDLEQMIETDPDPEHARMLEESIRAKNFEQN